MESFKGAEDNYQQVTEQRRFRGETRKQREVIRKDESMGKEGKEVTEW